MQAFSEDFLSLYKWFKIVRLRSRGVNVSPSLAKDSQAVWPDVVLKIKLWRFTLGDDPFEVKLRWEQIILIGW